MSTFVRINKESTALEQTVAYSTGGLNAFYWFQIFALDFAVVEVQEMLSSHGDLLTIAMYHHGFKAAYSVTMNIFRKIFFSF